MIFSLYMHLYVTMGTHLILNPGGMNSFLTSNSDKMVISQRICSPEVLQSILQMFCSFCHPFPCFHKRSLPGKDDYTIIHPCTPSGTLCNILWCSVSAINLINDMKICFHRTSSIIIIS